MHVKTIHDPRYRKLVAVLIFARKESGITQARLAGKMRVSRQTIQKLESCEVKLDILRYVRLCRILGIEPGPLLGRLEEPSDEEAPLYLAEAFYHGSPLKWKFIVPIALFSTIKNDHHRHQLNTASGTAYYNRASIPSERHKEHHARNNWRSSNSA